MMSDSIIVSAVGARNALLFQIVNQILGNPVVYLFYDIRVLISEAPLPRKTIFLSETLSITMIYTSFVKEVV